MVYQFLPLDQLVTIATAESTGTAAALALQLGRPYSVVVQAVAPHPAGWRLVFPQSPGGGH